MGRINVKEFADLFELSPMSLGLLFGQIGLSVDLETETFEGQHLIEKLKGVPIEKIVALKKKTNNNRSVLELSGHDLRAEALSLFRTAGLYAEWEYTGVKRANTLLRVVSTSGKSILVGVRSSNSIRKTSTHGFIVAKPYQTWYCLIINSIEFVHLRRKEDFLSLNRKGNTDRYNISTNLKYTSYLFKNQIEEFKAELESL